MKLSKDEFKSLQDEWYKKLRDSGFEDIEAVKEGEFVLLETAAHWRRYANRYANRTGVDYFRQLTYLVNNEETVFKNDVHRYILVRHSEGAKIKEIIEELLARGESRHRNVVRFIIRRYEMLWGLRSYEPRELDKKKA